MRLYKDSESHSHILESDNWCVSFSFYNQLKTVLYPKDYYWRYFNIIHLGVEHHEHQFAIGIGILGLNLNIDIWEKEKDETQSN